MSADVSRPILCGVDDSDFGRAAVRVARDLSDSLGSPLVLVHVLPGRVPPGTSAVPHGRSRLLTQERRSGELLLAEVAADASLGGRVERRVVFGDPATALTDIARDDDAEMIVLGSHGRGSLASAVLGSVSRAVAAGAPCPVAIVPASVARSDAKAPTAPTKEAAK